MSRQYVTVQGDMWDRIAFTQLGSTAYTGSLMNLNRQYRDWYTFPAGVVLVLPDPAEHVSGTLPPWKRSAG